MWIAGTWEPSPRGHEGLERVHAMMGRLREDVRRFIVSAAVKGQQK